MFSLGLGPRIYLSPQSDDPSGGGYQERKTSDPTAPNFSQPTFSQPTFSQRTFSHSRALPLEEALEVLMVECLRTYISALPKTGLLPDFCLRHETLKDFIRNQPGFGQVLKGMSGSAMPPLAILGTSISHERDELEVAELLPAVRSSLQRLSLQPHLPTVGDAQGAPEKIESILAKKIDSALKSLFAKFLRSKSEENTVGDSFERWIDMASLGTLCSAIETTLKKPNFPALSLLGKSRQFEVMNALSEEQSLPCAEFLVDYAVVEILSGQDTDWVNCQHARLLSGEDPALRSLSDEVYAAVSSSWESHQCACRELIVMPAEDFFGKFPGITEFEDQMLARVHVALLPALESDVPPRLYVFQLSAGGEALPEHMIRNLEWAAFKYGTALRRILTRTRDEA